MPQSTERSGSEFEDMLDLVVSGTKRRVEVLFRIGDELKKESDRGCALVAAAYLENEVGELLGNFFVKQSAKARAALFEFNGPVGTFSSKIKMSAALGLMPEEIFKSLDLIRKMRNEFAHLHEPLDFESPKIKRQVENLLPSLCVPEASARESFIVKVQSIAATLHLCISNAVPQVAPKYEQVPICADASAQEIEIAARRLMKATAPSITYEEAIDLARDLRGIKSR